MAKHRVEMAGAEVLIEDGKVEVLTDPQVRSCPLRRQLYGHGDETRETVRAVLETHIETLGMYTENRVLELDEKPVSYGASEMLMDCLTEGVVECVVTACDGAGTVAVTKPRVLQAIGAHMTGLIETEPIPKTQQGLRALGCHLLDDAATLNQVEGVKLAAREGYQKIAVTLCGKKARDARAIRELEAREGGIEVTLFAVHTLGMSEQCATAIAETADVVCSCSSAAARQVIGKRALIQIGVGIPVFALTQRGKAVVLTRALHFSDPLLITRSRLPVAPGMVQPRPLT